MIGLWGFYRRKNMGDPDNVGRNFTIFYLFILAGVAFTLNFYFTGSVEITGRVLDQSGKPLSGVAVTGRISYMDSKPRQDGRRVKGPDDDVDSVVVTTGPSGLFYIESERWFIERIRIESMVKEGRPLSWILNPDKEGVAYREPQKGLKYLLLKQHFGSETNPYVFWIIDGE